jgi:hypothetical protein
LIIAWSVSTTTFGDMLQVEAGEPLREGALLLCTFSDDLCLPGFSGFGLFETVAVAGYCEDVNVMCEAIEEIAVSL